MQNDPSLHHDQQNQADHLIKTKGSEKAADFADENEQTSKDDLQEKPAGKHLSEAEKEEQTDPYDFEPFALDKLDKINKGDDHLDKKR